MTPERVKEALKIQEPIVIGVLGTLKQEIFQKRVKHAGWSSENCVNNHRAIIIDVERDTFCKCVQTF